jgi:NAD(P)H dehydrogenase (quinone)
MRVLIVHAHHEPRSFSSALCRQAVETLTELGHEVRLSDLYTQRFDPVSDRRNFSSVLDSDYLKQQFEERHASDVGGFAPELEAEIQKLEWCDLLIFNFPLWWFGMPGILKGWVDRAFPMRRIYGDGKLYETGTGQGRKRAMVMMTVGGVSVAYDGYGVNPPMKSILAPIEHGVFWFNGFRPLAPFLAWGPARITHEERVAYLRQLDARLRDIENETPRTLAPLADFPGFGKDRKRRFLVTCKRRAAPNDTYLSLVPAERARVAELERAGILLDLKLSAPDADPWRAFLLMREADAEAVGGHLSTLPLAPYLDFEITELETL